jgi:hypothetical protein
LQAALLHYPHHITGEQYLILNVLGAEHKLAAHWITVPRDGSITIAGVERLCPLPRFAHEVQRRRVQDFTDILESCKSASGL